MQFKTKYEHKNKYIFNRYHESQNKHFIFNFVEIKIVSSIEEASGSRESWFKFCSSKPPIWIFEEEYNEFTSKN